MKLNWDIWKKKYIYTSKKSDLSTDVIPPKLPWNIEILIKYIIDFLYWWHKVKSKIKLGSKCDNFCLILFLPCLM